MIERWRKPVRVLHIEETGEAIVTPDGRIQRMPMIVLDEESKERLRLGYVCVKCFEPFETPWPERCNVCGCRVGSEQREYFAREFEEKIMHLGSRISLDEERERLREGEVKDQ